MVCSKGGHCGQSTCMTKKTVDGLSNIVCYFIPTNFAACVAAVSATIGGVIIYASGSLSGYSSNKLSYKPLSSNDLESMAFLAHYPSKKIIANPEKVNLIFAHENGGDIWSKNLSMINLANGKDNIYFSLCSTKIYEEKVSTIKNFDPSNDKIWFFCTQKPVSVNEIRIDNNSNPGFSCVEVRDTAVCVQSSGEFTMDNIGVTDKSTVDSIFTSDNL